MGRAARLFAFAVGILVVGGSAAYYAATRPRLYEQCESPDGSWTVKVYRSWGLLSVRVSVKAASSDGSASFERAIDSRDDFADVEDRYSDISCENREARIGPKYWDGTRFGYFVVRKDDLSSPPR